MNLIPEKRLDKTGKLVTRYVRASGTTAATGKVLPAPTAAPSETSKSASKGTSQVTYKRRAKTHHTDTLHQYSLSTPLRGEGNYFRSHKVSFIASDVDLYAVAAVAYDADALLMLSEGVRTSEEAVSFMRERGMEPPFDRTEIAQEALRRNIPFLDYRDFMRGSNVPREKMDSPYLVDAMTLYGKVAIREQYYSAFHDILDGKVRADDIKKLGLTNLKPHKRLEASMEALREVNKPDAKFTIDDVKELLLRCNSAGTQRTEAEYRVALLYLINEGPEFVQSVSTYTLLAADQSHVFAKDRFERTKFHVAFNKNYGHMCNPTEVNKIYHSGVDMHRAAELIQGGLKVDNAIRVIEDEIAPGLGSGWL